MAYTFKNVLYEVTNTLATFYTTPVATTTIVIGCQAVNNTAGTVALDLAVDDGVDVEKLLNDLSLPAGASANCVAGKLVLEASHELQAQCGVTGDVSIVLSVMEIT